MHGRDTSLGGQGVNFAETAWGMVERARHAEPQIRQGGLEELSRNYWKPVYHYVRVAWAKSNDDAKDLAQAFFLWLVDSNVLERYAPERGSFRSFLKALLRHFVQHQDEALSRLKRGGGHSIVTLDEEGSQLEEVLPDPRASNPEEVFEREWRKTLMAAAVERVRRKLQSDGGKVKFRVFEAYYMNPTPDEPTYSGLAAQLKLKESEVQHYLADVREDIRQEIRAQLAQTVSHPDDLREEWNAFFAT